MRTAFATIALAVLLNAGCKSAAQVKKEAELQDAMASPLPLDPTEKLELSPWWTNGRQLLQLSDDGTYRLYGGTNRYHKPAEKGAWWQQSYATLWLDPYADPPLSTTRVVIRRSGGRLLLDVRDLAAMTELADPPVVVEDRLIGVWTGEAGSLMLGADLRYRFERRAPQTSAPARLGSEEGIWQVDAKLLILEPDSAGMPPTLMRIREGNATIELESSGGPLVRKPSRLEQG